MVAYESLFLLQEETISNIILIYWGTFREILCSGRRHSLTEKQTWFGETNEE
jgi:hypothetical protein